MRPRADILVRPYVEEDGANREIRRREHCAIAHLETQNGEIPGGSGDTASAGYGRGMRPACAAKEEMHARRSAEWPVRHMPPPCPAGECPTLE